MRMKASLAASTVVLTSSVILSDETGGISPRYLWPCQNAVIYGHKNSLGLTLRKGESEQRESSRCGSRTVALSVCVYSILTPLGQAENCPLMKTCGKANLAVGGTRLESVGGGGCRYRYTS